MKHCITIASLLITVFCFGQNIATVKQDKVQFPGTVAFRNLEEKSPEEFYRVVALNNEGTLGYIAGNTLGYGFASMDSTFLEKSIQFQDNNDHDINGLSIKVDLIKDTDNVIMIHFNIPVFIDLPTIPTPIADNTNVFLETRYAGVKLIRKDSAGNIVELSGGARKKSFADIYSQTNDIEIFLEGMWLDNINTGSADETYTYYLVGYIEGYNPNASPKENIYFSKDVALDDGVAEMSIKVYNKKIYNNTTN